jgi:(E)-4-hydroxy-3-methylbut-2-enyl-diphosphate synthase
MPNRRRPTRPVVVGKNRPKPVVIGGDAPIAVQSMTKVDTRDADATLAQIRRMAEAGCEIVRVSVPNREAAEAMHRIVRESPIPVVADIHFDWRLALASLRAGVDKLRLNPGNIGSYERIKEVVTLAKAMGTPIRIGVNSGSLERDILAEYGHPRPEALVASAKRHIRYLEDLDFTDIVVSLKASDVPTMVEAYRLLATECDYPFHLGVTESGTVFSGTIRSAMGIGILLYEGIGDTIRVSLAGDVLEEIRVGREILKGLGLRVFGPTVVACPTCARCDIDVMKVAEEVERRVSGFTVPVRISVLGCAVNGPGEAKESDIGIAGGPGFGLLYKKGEKAGRVTEAEMIDTLVEEVRRMQEAYDRGGR